MIDKTLKRAKKCSVLLLVIVVSLLSGCGQSVQTGPSDEKVKLDFKDSLQLLSRHMRSPMDLKYFKIVERKILSEDRVMFHLEVAISNIPEKMTVLYQLGDGGVWKVINTTNGHL
jgi:hypothetical protein